jgi:CRP/FNR family transcriptional regulator
MALPAILSEAAMPDKAPRPAPPQPACLTCPQCAKTHATPWSDLDSQEITFLDRHKLPQAYRAGTILYLPGTPCLGLYCVASGTLLIERISENGTRGVALLEEGEIAGWLDFFRGGTYSGRAMAESDAVVCHIPAKAVQSLIDRAPLVATRLLLRAVAESDRIAMDALEQRYASARQRLARALMILRQHHGTGAESGEITIGLPMSRRDLADLIAIRPETLSRAIHELERNGVALFSGRTVRIPDLDRMMDELEIAGNGTGAVDPGAAGPSIQTGRPPEPPGVSGGMEGDWGGGHRPLDESA